MNCSTTHLLVHHQLPEFTQTHVHRIGDAIQPSHPLSSLSPPASNPSQHQSLFQWVNSSHEVAKVLEFQPQHQSFQWTPGLISFKMDWLDLFAVQGTLKSLFQQHSSKVSILQRSAFFSPTLLYKYDLLPSCWSPSCFLALLCSHLPWVLKKYIYIIWKAFSSPVLPYSVRPHSGYLHT